MTDLPILIREYRETDKAFIVDSWVNSMAYSCPSLFWVPRNLVHSKYRTLISSLVDARPELFRVLVNEADENQIFAWVCGDDDVCHFVYVKEDFRHEGLGGKLWTSGIVSNWTHACEDIRAIYYKPSLFKGLINGIN